MMCLQGFKAQKFDLQKVFYILNQQPTTMLRNTQYFIPEVPMYSLVPEDTVLLIGTLLLFDPVLFPKYEA